MHTEGASDLAGQGKEHAKWSPVATAWYKLLPEIVITKVQPCSPVHHWVTLPQQSPQFEACYECCSSPDQCNCFGSSFSSTVSMQALLKYPTSMPCMHFYNGPCSVSAR